MAEKKTTRRGRKRETDVSLAPEEAARAADLRYVTDRQPGLRRQAIRDGFRYLDPDGSTVRDEATLKRIRSLAIPPAWTEVWICGRANGHLQATGRDARGRKQYKYHPRWRTVRDETKYGRLALFAETLPRIRAAVQSDLALPGLPRSKVLAIVVRLLETTFIRVGNEEYARTNKSFGLTTLKNRHVDIQGSSVKFRFVGKSGRAHQVKVSDKRVARLVKRMRDLAGQDLFQYLDDDGEPQPITSADVNEYLRAVSGEEFTAKDFRTWAGTLLAARRLSASDPFESKGSAKKAAVAAVEAVAVELGNTPAVCRKCYIHPTVLEAFGDEDRFERWTECVAAAKSRAGLDEEEAALLNFLEHETARSESAAPRGNPPPAAGRSV
jgi:DNA topoisomerase I